MIYIMAGPCAVESREGISKMAYTLSLIDELVDDEYEIELNIRGGAWKPRTLLKENGEKVFEGTREGGLKWMADEAEKYSLPIITEVMSEMDIRHFHRYLDPERDILQIGARTSQAFALLYAIGGTAFAAMIKNPQHGVNVKEAKGAIERLENNREKLFCIRGYQLILPDEGSDEYESYMDELYSDPDQHRDSRNVNNIKDIHRLREDPFFDDVLMIHDPSHTWGGKTDEMRRKIGEYAIKAITEHKYDGIIIEVKDDSADAKCDAAQALVTTTNGIDWSKTYVGEEPEIMPITLVDIVCEIMAYQAEQLGLSEEKLEKDQDRLRRVIRWDMSP